MTVKATKRVFDALAACAAIRQFISGADFASYEKDLLLRSAVERQFEILGEALGKASAAEPTLEERLPDLRRIVGLRNRIIHGYDTVSLEAYFTRSMATFRFRSSSFLNRMQLLPVETLPRRSLLFSTR